MYFGLLSLLFGMAFWLSYANEETIRHNPEFTYETEERQVKNYETYEFYSNISDIKWYIWNIAIYLVISFFISFVLLCLIFKKMREKWWRESIPFYNIYTLFKFVWVKSVYLGLIWISILIMIIFWFINSVNCSNCSVPINEDWSINWEMYYHFSWTKIIGVIFGCLVWLYFSLLMFIVYYRLFKKFGWEKWTSTLWAIFFPIWVCILWFGDYHYQWKESENSSEK